MSTLDKRTEPSPEQRELLYEKTRILYIDHIAAAKKCLYVAAEILADAESHHNNVEPSNDSPRASEIVRFLREWSELVDFFPEIPKSTAWWLENRNRIQNDAEDMIG